MSRSQLPGIRRMLKFLACPKGATRIQNDSFAKPKPERALIGLVATAQDTQDVRHTGSAVSFGWQPKGSAKTPHAGAEPTALRVIRSIEAQHTNR